jgi:hypothetical protein
MAKPSTPTKAELHEMLAEAVRNTQPQPQPQPQPEPIPDAQPRKTRSAPKRAAKIKSVRRKKRPR